MALTIEQFITSSWVDVTGSCPLQGDPRFGLQPFQMEQVRESNISVLRFSMDQGNAAMTLGREIRVMVDGDKWFGGYITTREQIRFGAAAIVYGANYECQDYNVLLDRIVVPGYTVDQGDTDSTEVATLRATYLAGAGVTAGDIQTVQASMPADLELLGTFRECMESIAGAAGGAVFFINPDKELNYAAAGTDFGLSGVENLSDDLTVANSHPYGDFVERADESRRVTDVYIIGDGIEGWYPTPASGFYYQKIVSDETIKTQAALDALGAAIVDDFGTGLVEYSLRCWEDSFWTYGEARVRHSDFIGGSGEDLWIRRSVCTARSKDGEEREYILEFGDHTIESDYLGPAPGEGGGGMSNHNLLSDPHHGDTTNATPTQGALIVGNSTPLWDGLAHPGATGQALVSTATDTVWDNTPTWYGPHTWYDGVGNSPAIRFQGASNDDIAYIYLNDDAVANDSDLMIRLAGNDDDARLIIEQNGLTDIAYISGAGHLWIEGDLLLTTGDGVIHADGVAAGQILVADGTRYVPGTIADAGGAPNDAQYVVMALDGDLSAERVLTAGDGLELTDGGANGNATLAVDLVAAWSGLEFSGGDLRIDLDATFNAWTGVHTFSNTVNLAEYLVHSGDADTYLQFQTDNITLRAGGVDMIHVVEGATDYVNIEQGLLFVGDTANGSMGRGITINQGGNDDESFTVKSSDLAHTLTDQTEADTYGFLNKYQATSGGLRVTGIKSSAGTNAHALRLRGFLDEAPQTTKTTASYGVLTFGAWEGDGANDVKEITTADANLFSWDTAGVTKMILDTESHLWLSGSDGALWIDQLASDDSIIRLKSSTDISHPFTTYIDQYSYAGISKMSGTLGGVLIRGFKETSATASPWKALQVEGFLGEAADTTKTTAGHGIVSVSAYITNGGTGATTVGADGNLFSIENGGVTRFLFDAEGSAHADVEWITFDEHDDLVLLDELESSFGEFAEGHRTELEALGIAHFDDRPGHAMVNWTRLQMLLVGAVRQMGARLERYERLLEGGR